MFITHILFNDEEPISVVHFGSLDREENMAFKTATDTVLRVLIGGWDMSLEILLIVMTLDYLTGVVCAFRNKSVNSSTGYKGLLKKSTILIIIILAAQVDRMLGTDNHVFRNCTALSFTVNDALSILENVGKMGVRFPRFLMVALEKLQEEIDTMPDQRVAENNLPATDKPSIKDKSQRSKSNLN